MSPRVVYLLSLSLSAGDPEMSSKLVGRGRLELTTNSLKGYCSTIELPTLGRGGRNRTDE